MRLSPKECGVWKLNENLRGSEHRGLARMTRNTREFQKNQRCSRSFVLGKVHCEPNAYSDDWKKSSAFGKYLSCDINERIIRRMTKQIHLFFLAARADLTAFCICFSLSRRQSISGNHEIRLRRQTYASPIVVSASLAFASTARRAGSCSSTMVAI